jgi:hypothetical protein
MTTRSRSTIFSCVVDADICSKGGVVPRRMVTQKDLDAAQKLQTQCYLCGKALPPKGTIGRSKQIVREHIIPSCILGDSPGSGAFPVILPVHKECETQHKRSRDELVRTLQRLTVVDPSSWSDADTAAFSRRFCIELGPEVRGEPIPAISGVDGIVEGVALWIRGLYTTLYGEVLPPQVRQVIQAPAPSFRTDGARSPEEQLAQYELARTAVLGRIIKLAELDEDDRIEAWNGAVHFHGTWRVAIADWGGPWAFFWVLVIPGVWDWGTRVTGRYTPWHGVMLLEEKPSLGTAFSDEEVDALGRRAPKR